MPIAIPFLKSDSHYNLAVPIDDQQIIFYVRWNSRDQAFYLDMYEPDDTIIELNIKVVTGIPLAKRSIHPFFCDHTMTAIDTSGEGRNPGFDELGGRVQVVIQNTDSLD